MSISSPSISVCLLLFLENLPDSFGVQAFISLRLLLVDDNDEDGKEAGIKGKMDENGTVLLGLNPVDAADNENDDDGNDDVDDDEEQEEAEEEE